MKRIYILFFAVIMLISLCSCGKNTDGEKGEGSSMRSGITSIDIIGETPDMPIKIIYQRDRMYSAIFETDDADIIADVVSALRAVKPRSRSTEAVDDHEDIITLIYEDGSKKSVRFEFERLIYDGERYDVDGYDRVISALSAIVTEDTEN